MKIVQKKFPVLMRDQELAREVEKRAVRRQEEVRETAKRIEVVAVGLLFLASFPPQIWLTSTFFFCRPKSRRFMSRRTK